MHDILLIATIVGLVSMFVGVVSYDIAKDRWYKRGYAQAVYEMQAFRKFLSAQENK